MIQQCHPKRHHANTTAVYPQQLSLFAQQRRRSFRYSSPPKIARRALFFCLGSKSTARHRNKELGKPNGTVRLDEGSLGMFP